MSQTQPKKLVEFYLMEGMMMQRFSAHVLLLSVVGNLLIPSHANTISNSLSREPVNFLQAEALSNSNLLITIQGLKSQRGQVCLSLFANGRGFPNREADAVQARCVKATSTPLVVAFENLQPGSYAVAVFHDVNGDGKLHRSVLGIPTEEFGFSQNPQIVAGPPKFGDSAVFVAGSETDIQIHLQSF